MIYHKNLGIPAGITHSMIQFRKLKLPGSNLCPKFISGEIGQVSTRSRLERPTTFQLSQRARLPSPGHPGLGGVSEDKTGSRPQPTGSCSVRAPAEGRASVGVSGPQLSRERTKGLIYLASRVRCFLLVQQ